MTQREFFTWLSQQLGKPMPPSASESESAPRKRGITHKRVSNRRLRTELGYALKFPTFRAGYMDELRRLGLA